MNPLRIDPTRTLTLRREFTRGTSKAFRRLYAAVSGLVSVEDVFGLSDRLAGVPGAPPVVSGGRRTSYIPPHDPTGNASYSYRSTQVNITDVGVLSELDRIKRRIAPEDVLRFEEEPHITVRYSLHDYRNTAQRVRELVGGAGTVSATISGLGVFEGTKNGDVLILRVDSPDLKRLNELLGTLPNTETHAYSPHITVAYLEPGTAMKYIRKTAVDWHPMTFDTLLVSDREGNKEEVSLIAPVSNRRWAHKTQDERVAEFERWLRRQVDKELLSEAESERWRRFVSRGFEVGANRALNDVRRGKGRGAKTTRLLDTARASGFEEGRRETLLREMLSRTTAREKLRLLQSSALSEVRGLTDDLVSKGRRVVTDALVRNQTPKELATRLRAVLGVSESRARTIANTELVRAHAEAQLEAMEQQGVTEVGVAVEWSSLKSACSLCSPLDGVVLRVEEARGMIPRHPNCRCAWTLANLGEDKSGQKRSKTKIDRAVKKSQREGGGTDEWAPNVPVSRERPKDQTRNHACDPACLEFAGLLARLGLT